VAWSVSSRQTRAPPVRLEGFATSQGCITGSQCRGWRGCGPAQPKVNDTGTWSLQAIRNPGTTSATPNRHVGLNRLHALPYSTIDVRRKYSNPRFKRPSLCVEKPGSALVLDPSFSHSLPPSRPPPHRSVLNCPDQKPRNVLMKEDTALLFRLRIVLRPPSVMMCESVR